VDLAIKDCALPEKISPVADGIRRRPLWPAFVIAFATFVTMLWTALLLWLLSQMMLLFFDPF
jgi:hypothetical protein